MANTKDPAARVARYRAEYADRVWERDTDALKLAYEAGVSVCNENAFDALLAGDPAEAQVWATIATNISYRYRRAF
jgi:hypothetical protein